MGHLYGFKMNNGLPTKLSLIERGFHHYACKWKRCGHNDGHWLAEKDRDYYINDRTDKLRVGCDGNCACVSHHHRHHQRGHQEIYTIYGGVVILDDKKGKTLYLISKFKRVTRQSLISSSAKDKNTVSVVRSFVRDARFCSSILKVTELTSE